MADIIEMGGVTKLPVPPDKILEAAKGNLDTAVIIGWDKEGDFYFAASVADAPEVSWLLEKAKQVLLSYKK